MRTAFSCNVGTGAVVVVVVGTGAVVVVVEFGRTTVKDWLVWRG